MNEISLLSETIEDDIVKMDLEYENLSFKIIADGETTLLSKEMTAQIIDFVKSIDRSNLNQKMLTTIEMRIKHIDSK